MGSSTEGNEGGIGRNVGHQGVELVLCVTKES